MENILIMKLERRAKEKYQQLQSKVDNVKVRLYETLVEEEEFIKELAFIEFCIEYFEDDLVLEIEEFKNYLIGIANKIRDLKYQEIKLDVVKEMYLKGSSISDCKIIKFRNK